MSAQLEHANITVKNPDDTAAWMLMVFGWQVRWQGDAIAGGRSVHIGTQDQYIALYTPKEGLKSAPNSHTTVGSLNHIGVVVDDLDAAEAAVKAQGFETTNHADYEPGRRFYFHDNDGVEYELVEYGG
ncbi:Catechol 2,3-dioxygenase [Sulfitobacter marinus]|uniref:Catechol 2,3-dioxygenase n=1 Tax=Sulfitobacter marinus TaxID=394264 RepID=A0A1I6RHW2_9RHOB|nr:VOC family protein [Sulfitobacter marinus]SFS64256.1 Catechol 2,3-dioxygenase [Sulfitobacter marinus]